MEDIRRVHPGALEPIESRFSSIIIGALEPIDSLFRPSAKYFRAY